MKRKRHKKCRSLRRHLKSNQHGTSAGSDDGSTVDSYREPHNRQRRKESPESLLEAPEASRQPPKQVLQAPEVLLEPKHKIFLSHSGADKDFTWQLCEDLERVHHFPFFDKRDDSLPKGEKFPPLIMEAAKKCRVAILVLSDEFFIRSKWPMIELNAFVKAQKLNNHGLKILPLFLGLTMDQFNERRESWLEKWKNMSKDDDRINVKEWQDALSTIPGAINAMEYTGPGEGHVAFRKRVVEAVCNLVRPDVQWDVTHVQSKDVLSKPILEKLKEIKKQKVRVVGLYGMGGVGKTTIAHVVCNQMLVDLHGKACYVEFGSMNLVEMRKIILQELTEASLQILGDALGKLDQLLKDRMGRQRVFLALDNICDCDVDEARKFLEVGHHAESMVLLTSRSLDVLKSLGIDECDCLEMPELDEKGATDLFLHYSGKSEKLPMNEDERNIIERCVKECHFLKGWDNVGSSKEMECVYQYLPLALKTLGSQLRSTSDDVLRWEEILKKLEGDKSNSKFNLRNEGIHPIFCVLRSGFDALPEKDQYLFLDLALLFLPKQRERQSKWISKSRELSNLWKWFRTIHRKREDEMNKAVNGLRGKGLLDIVSEANELQFSIHDLYLDFAEAEAQAGPFERRRFLIDKGNEIRGPPELRKNPPGVCWSSLERVIIHNKKVQSLADANLHFCSNVEVLELFGCDELEVLDVTGMGCLRSVEIFKCGKLRGGFWGLDSLRDLVVLRFVPGFWFPLGFDFICNLCSLTTLEILELDFLVWPKNEMFPPDLSASTNLQELYLRNIRVDDATFNCRGFDNLPQSLMKIDFFCSTLGRSSINSLILLPNLQYLSLSKCEGVTDCAGFSRLRFSQTLITHPTRNPERSDFREDKKLQVLDVSGCLELTSLAGIVYATALKHVNASQCRNLKELPDGLSDLEKLETLNLCYCSAICTLPKDYKSLAERGIPRVRGCWGLIIALVQELPHKECLNSISYVWRGEKSMQLWIDAMRKANGNAYDLLKQVLAREPGVWFDREWPSLLDYGENLDDDFVVRALCEHGDVGGQETNRLSDVVAQLFGHYVTGVLWAVVATAPCTFEVLMERALLEPWDKTLLHSTIVTILPDFLCSREIRDSGVHGETNWLNRGIEVVLLKCKEQLNEASDRGMDHVRTSEGLEVVGTLFRELEATEYGRNVSSDSKFTNLYDSKPYLSSYSEMYPNFPFGQALALQELDNLSAD